MNKHLIPVIGGAIGLLVLTFIGISVHDDHLHKQEDLNRPNNLGSYHWEKGSFKFDPMTILESLESGDTNVFRPILWNDDLEEIPDLSIYWTQDDFLKIASALGQLVWDDSMDLKDWNLYDIFFDGSCGDSNGFYSASITYFKTEKNSYRTRLIMIEPYFGLASWGGENSYPKPILRKWKGVDLAGAKVSADEVLRMVSEDLKAHSEYLDNNYGVYVYLSRFDPDYWHLDIMFGSIYYAINLETGVMTQGTK
jgi:hypothetical protein